MSRRLIALLDTATEITTVGLAWLDDAGAILIDAALVDAHRAAMSRLLPTLASLLAANGLSVADVSEVLVGRGPGSFTGVRIGVATAKGLAHGLGVPLWGVGTLDAIAWGLADDDLPAGSNAQEALLGVLGDAMRGEVYPALFECESGRVRRLAPDRVAKPADAAREWASLEQRIVLAGNGLRKYGDLFRDALGRSAEWAPQQRWAPSALGMLGAYGDAISRGELGNGDPGGVLPIYTRLSDAEEAETARLSDTSGAVPGSGVAGEGGR